jgi:hypothetical protein
MIGKDEIYVRKESKDGDWSIIGNDRDIIMKWWAHSLNSTAFI